MGRGRTGRVTFRIIWITPALAIRPFPLSSPEMVEAAIGGVRTGRLAAFAFTLIILAL